MKTSEMINLTTLDPLGLAYSRFSLGLVRLWSRFRPKLVWSLIPVA